MAKIVKPQILASGSSPGLVPMLVQGDSWQVPAGARREQQTIPPRLRVPGKVLDEHRREVRRNRDIPDPGIGLRRALDRAAPSVDDASPNMHDGAVGRGVLAAQ